jgi:hypothetical protein
VMSMPSTVALNCMTGHRIIYTIPAAITASRGPAPLAQAPGR